VVNLVFFLLNQVCTTPSWFPEIVFQKVCFLCLHLFFCSFWTIGPVSKCLKWKSSLCTRNIGLTKPLNDLHVHTGKLFAIELVTFAVDLVPLAVEFGAFAVEFIGFAVQFVAFALQFVTLAMELDALAMGLGMFTLELVTFALEFITARMTSWSKHANKM